MTRGNMRLMGMESDGAIGNVTASLTTGAMPWTLTTFGLMVVMWWIMMIGMMVPSAAPMILTFARVQRNKLTMENPDLRIALFILGYLLLWLSFSFIATLLQWGFGLFALLSPMMTSSSKYFSVTIFLLRAYIICLPLNKPALRNANHPLFLFHPIGAKAIGVPSRWALPTALIV